jgi:hypothetical protein
LILASRNARALLDMGDVLTALAGIGKGYDETVD